jgi:hypothetical protein
MIIGSERFALNQTIPHQHGGGAKKEAPARGETGARGAASLPEVREPGRIVTLDPTGRFPGGWRGPSVQSRLKAGAAPMAPLENAHATCLVTHFLS